MTEESSVRGWSNAESEKILSSIHSVWLNDSFEKPSFLDYLSKKKKNLLVHA